MRVTSIHDTRQDKIFNAVTYVLLGLFALAVLYPLVYIVSASISDPLAVSSGEVWLWPVDLNLNGYRAILEYDSIVRGFLNSLWYAGVGSLISLSLTLLAAYPLSRRDLWGRNFFMFFFVFTMLFTGGLIPTYLVVHDLVPRQAA